MLPQIYLATEDDAPSINAIYNHYVVHSTATYQTERSTFEERLAWFAAHGPHHPVIILKQEGKILAWASLSPFHARAAFGRTVENSVYVHYNHLRQGYGKLLLADLIERARSLGHHTIIAGVDTEQIGSLKLHASFGFNRVGYLKQVGYKFNRWLDVIYLQLLL